VEGVHRDRLMSHSMKKVKEKRRGSVEWEIKRGRGQSKKGKPKEIRGGKKECEVERLTTGVKGKEGRGGPLARAEKFQDRSGKK